MRKPKMTILASAIMVTIVSIALGAGTMAWFSDTETATMTVNSGTVNVKLSKDNGGSWHNGLDFSFPNDFAPGDTYTIEVWIKNTGSAGLKNLFVTGDNLGGANPGLADVIHITDVAYTDRDFDTGSQMWVHPGSGTFYQTVFGDDAAPFTVTELANGLDNEDRMNFCWGDGADVHGDYLPANGGRIQKFYMEFTFDEDAGNNYQGLTCSFDLLFRGTDEPGTFVWYPS